ncbi:hypothetical protein ACSSS7_005466 [Eimeria intestinalis]
MAARSRQLHLLGGYRDKATPQFGLTLWMSGAGGRNKRLSPLHRLVASSDKRSLQDVAWKRGDGEGEVIVAVGDDGQLTMWDLRVGTSPVHRVRLSVSEAITVYTTPHKSLCRMSHDHYGERCLCRNGNIWRRQKSIAPSPSLLRSVDCGDASVLTHAAVKAKKPRTIGVRGSAGNYVYLAFFLFLLVVLPQQSCNHSCANALALNAVAPNVFATGGADAEMFDQMVSALACTTVGTTDRLVRIFDCSLIGAEQSPEEAEEGPPEIVFIHGGHVATITELDWNSLDDEFPWVIASASEDNVLQIWQPAVKAFEADEASYLHEDGSMDEEVLD